MKVQPSAQMGRTGTAAVTFKFEKLGYTFREQPISDYGVDAHVEPVEDGLATGRLLGLQIKSGPSHFKERTESGFVFRFDQAHLDYWLNYPLLVLVVLYDPGSELAYWQVVRRDTVESTGQGWKLNVPYDQQLDESAKTEFRKLAGLTIEMERYTILSLDDVSHGGAKRYRANVLVREDIRPMQLKQLIKKITGDLRQRDYYRNEQTRQHWSGVPAQVVFLPNVQV